MHRGVYALQLMRLISFQIRLWFAPQLFVLDRDRELKKSGYNSQLNSINHMPLLIQSLPRMVSNKLHLASFGCIWLELVASSRLWWLSGFVGPTSL
jgi:hypothetical protein